MDTAEPFELVVTWHSQATVGETEGYNYMWKNARAENTEYSAFILSNGVLVNPTTNSNHDENTSYFDHYPTRQSPNTGSLQVFFDGKYRTVIGAIHTHQSENFPPGFSREDLGAVKMFKGAPLFVMGWNGKIDGIFSVSKDQYNYMGGAIGSNNLNTLLNGSFKLIPYIMNGK